MSKEIRIVQVCFNALDPYQLRLYEHVAGQTNRSAYVKRLIQNDMELSKSKLHTTGGSNEPKVSEFELEGFI